MRTYILDISLGWTEWVCLGGISDMGGGTAIALSKTQQDYIKMDPQNSDTNVIQYLSKIHKKSATTITNGIQNAIFHAWRVTAIEDLTKHYTARVSYETGVPTPMELIYFYRDKIKEMI